MTPGALPIDNLEPDAGEAFAAGFTVDQVIALSLAVTAKRLVDAIGTADFDEFRARVFGALDAGPPASANPTHFERIGGEAALGDGR